MSKSRLSNVIRALLDRNGQAIYYAVFGFIPLMGMAGLSIDVGHAYIIRAALQNGTNAAALAAAGSTFTGQTQQAAADAFASDSGEANIVPYVTSTPNVSAVCVNMAYPAGSGLSCTTGSPANAVKVTQTASVPTYFLNVLNAWPFNCSSCAALTVGATAYASNAGPAQPWNMAVIIDSTGSMANEDSSCGASQMQCAMEGLQLLFSGLNPCPAPMTSCTNSQASLHVALFTFPELKISALPIATQCSGTATVNSYAPYTLPKPGLAAYHPDTDLQYLEGTTTWTASYEVTYGATNTDANGFLSDYYVSNAATGDMNPSSALVEAIGYGINGVNGATTSKVGCLPVAISSVNLNGFTPNPATGSPGSTTTVNTTAVGEGVTYYAPVIYAAQAALNAESILYPGAQNMMIILGDGQMNTQWIYLPKGTVVANVTTSSTVVANATDCSTYATTSLNPAANTCGFSNTNSVPNLSALAAYSIPVTATSPETEALTSGAGSGPISGLYPDFLDQCQQSISAAQWAAAQTTKTQIISIAYGVSGKGCISASESHTDDFNDVTLISLYGTPNEPFSISTLSPCIVMENLAQNPSGTFFNPNGTGSNLDNFFSDTAPSGSSTSCTSAVNPIAGPNANTLQSIFGLIKPRIQQAKLLPPNAS
jgi:Flp pilus assembly protein TadG